MSQKMRELRNTEEGIWQNPDNYRDKNMTYKLKRPLKKLSDEQFLEDIKRYIKSSYEFYNSKVPELRVLGRRLHEEYELKKFYKVFNKLWNSGYNQERSLAIYTLQLYKEDFDLDTWKFIKIKLKDMKSWDQIDSVSENIIGEILKKNSVLEKEIIKFSNDRSIWFKRISLISTIPYLKHKKNVKFSLKIVEQLLYHKENQIEMAVGRVLKEMSKIDPESTKRFILKHMNMSDETFMHSTENLKELRKIRKLKKLKPKKRKFVFWR